MPLQTHPDLIIVSFDLYIEGKDEPQIIPVDGQDEIHIAVPGGVKYYIKLNFKVKNRKLEDLNYKQIVKKGGVTIRTREVKLGSYEPSEEIRSVDFPEDETPGGWLMRGTYYATSYYTAGSETLMVSDWTLEITK
ncbi:uncharacterized protein KGF55_003376 [Candida pseudojiufengensis]|uniref:uncharacterized protein n=1 Tax=Candida pseudojiufengensis TaxID=497109 RepID=UPI0022254D82|nr:uncharacterized protein KGF55_003376 [Candida pseudojiufengensis]KAI5962300.1 hypothetical protein KGF55_003376 [Candida pseudojiufengensis]